MFLLICEPLLIYALEAILLWRYLYKTGGRDDRGMFSTVWELCFEVDYIVIEYLRSYYLKS